LSNFVATRAMPACRPGLCRQIGQVDLARILDRA
jgi:hypothetical protein